MSLYARHDVYDSLSRISKFYTAVMKAILLSSQYTKKKKECNEKQHISFNNLYGAHCTVQCFKLGEWLPVLYQERFGRIDLLNGRTFRTWYFFAFIYDSAALQRRCTEFIYVIAKSNVGLPRGRIRVYTRTRYCFRNEKASASGTRRTSSDSRVRGAERLNVVVISNTRGEWTSGWVGDDRSFAAVRSDQQGRVGNRNSEATSSRLQVVVRLGVRIVAMCVYVQTLGGFFFFVFFFGVVDVVDYDTRAVQAGGENQNERVIVSRGIR